MVTNCYGQFTDTPIDEAWFLKFNVLWLPTDHRKILNRQPEINPKHYPHGFGYIIIVNIPNGGFCLKDGDDIKLSDWKINWKVMNN